MTLPRSPRPSGRLFVISGPSGVGKTSVTRRLLELLPGLSFSVSVTTRDARPGEVDGRDYRFVSAHRFEQLVEEGAFLEHAEVFGRRYGTLAGPIEQQVSLGRNVVLDIDVQGAAIVRERMPDAVLVFLAPPSREELERRLRARGTENVAEMERRLARARWEMDQAGWFDRVVVNDDVERAASELAGIIGSEPGTPSPTAPSRASNPPEETASG